jgi:hypothetical protein
MATGMTTGMTVKGASLTIGIPERYIPRLRAAQLETYAGGRYYSARYLVASRILRRLQAIGYAEGLELDSMFSPHHRYVIEPMLPLSSRDLQATNLTHSVQIPVELAAWVEVYREAYGLSARSRAAVQLLDLDEVDEERVGRDVTRIAFNIPVSFAPQVEAWQTQSKKSGRTIALTSLVVYQLSAALSDAGIEHELPREARVRWRTTPSNIPELLANCSLKASIPRMLRPALERARAVLRTRGEVGNGEGWNETILRLLWTRVGKSLPDALRESNPSAFERPAPKPKTQSAPDVYAERFLTLCRERAARDRWLAQGGMGRPPPSTVDDHLGRRVYQADAQRVAIDRGLNLVDHVRTKKRQARGTGALPTW